MENDSVRTSGGNTLVDMWIDGKLRSISVSAEAIDAFLHLSRERSGALTDDDRREFVRTHLTLVVNAAATRLRGTEPDADSVTLERGDLGGRAAPQPSERAGAGDGERRSADRRQGDRRKINLGPPKSGERRRKD